MSDTEQLLARARLALRRESPGWKCDDAGHPGDVRDREEFDAIRFHPDASMDTSESLAQANLVHDSTILVDANKLKLAKRMLLRLVRFHTDRQVRFNTSVTQVLNGYANLLNRLANGSEQLKRASASGLLDLESRVLGLTSEIQNAAATMREELSGAERTRQDQAQTLQRLEGEAERQDKGLAQVVDELLGIRDDTERHRRGLRQLETTAREQGGSLEELQAGHGELRDRTREHADTLRELAEAATARARSEDRHEHLLRELQTELRGLRQEIELRQRTLHGEVDEQRRALGKRLEALEIGEGRQARELRGLTTTASQAVAAMERHERALTELREEVAALRSSSARHEGQLAETRHASTLAFAATERHEGIVGELREGVAGLRSEGAEHGQSIRELTSRVEESASAAARYEGVLSELRDRLSAAQSGQEDRDRSIGELSARAAAAQTDVARVEEALVNVAGEAERQQAELVELRGGVLELGQARAVQQHSLENLQSTATASADACQRQEEELGSIREQLAAVQQASEAADEQQRESLGELAHRTSESSREAQETIEGLSETLRGTGDSVHAIRAEVHEIHQRGKGIPPERISALYARFEERFRGSPEEIASRIEPYVTIVSSAAGQLEPGLPFLDLGCGRGELVAGLRRAGVAAEGIDANPAFAEACRSAGLPVHEGDLFEVLRNRPDASLSGVSAIQVVEHLQADALLELLELASRKICGSGLLLLETIDVRSLYALRWFFADPTHVLPLMPDTLGFYVEITGFTEIQTMPLHPVPQPVAPASARSQGIERLSSVVFGPQDFALFARRPPVHEPLVLPVPEAPATPRRRRSTRELPEQTKARRKTTERKPRRRKTRAQRKG